MSRIVRGRAELEAYLRDRGVDAATVLPPEDDFSMAFVAPMSYLDLIDWRNPNDPIRRQVIPDSAEAEDDDATLTDPIGDAAHSPVPGVVHRYRDRALLLLTAVCSVHCRFCFRRDFVGKPASARRPEQIDAAYAYVAAHPEIWEVIFSGGDILALPDTFIADALARARAIPHVRVLRIHTRAPVVDPERVTERLIDELTANAPTYVALHVNHPREVTPALRVAMGRLSDRGVPLLAQTVLLRGVNDDPAVLETLFRALVECRVRPYHLHHPDLARGTKHFRLPVRRGRTIVRETRSRLSGTAMPLYVLDIPGGHGKVPLEAAYVAENDGAYVAETFGGARHSYRDVT
ncbi:MAG: KamA family radical SAM protein [Chloroflexota bacterium]|nr:MAG: KamA family radical SAM protein [Chloroflexota bacterium]